MSAANVVAIIALLILSGAALAVLSPSTLAMLGIAAEVFLRGGPGPRLLTGTSVILAVLFGLGVARRLD